MNCFDHEKLDVYQAAINLVLLINTIVENLPRAGASIPLNIAECAGEFSANEKTRFG
jgi:23S rRNA-intervening sequence protein